MQATLPKDKVEQILGDIKIGQIVYTVPWAIKVDQNSKVWLNLDYDFQNLPSGTADTKVTKSDAGYEVELPDSARFMPQPIAKINVAPVVKLTWV